VAVAAATFAATAAAQWKTAFEVRIHGTDGMRDGAKMGERFVQRLRRCRAGSDQAKPELVVASAGKPSWASRRALPTSTVGNHEATRLVELANVRQRSAASLIAEGYGLTRCRDRLDDFRTVRLECRERRCCRLLAERDAYFSFSQMSSISSVVGQKDEADVTDRVLCKLGVVHGEREIKMPEIAAPERSSCAVRRYGQAAVVIHVWSLNPWNRRRTHRIPPPHGVSEPCGLRILRNPRRR